MNPSAVKSTLSKHYQARALAPDKGYFKINLYKGAEVQGLAKALALAPELERACTVECVMVADSYLMTHLGRTSTVLHDEHARVWFQGLMLELMTEVHSALQTHFPAQKRPLLMADMPDGTTASVDAAKRMAQAYLARGADYVKMEVPNARDLEIFASLASEFPMVAHLGYAPQGNQNRRYGTTVDECLELFAKAREVRDMGAVGMVLERVDVNVNQALSRPNPKGLPIHSIFSGFTAGGGQSLNIFDSVIKPDFNASFFPPTARYAREDFPKEYTVQNIAECMAELMTLASAGSYPRSPLSKLPLDVQAEIATLDPWA
jgi:ketopantoate hydroxymethyltransferase